MVIFHSYVKLPEGNIDSPGTAKKLWSQVEASRLGTLAHLNGHAIWRNSDPHRLDLPGHGMAQISDMKYFCRKKNVEIML
jgi:hypothetical protein